MGVLNPTSKEGFVGAVTGVVPSLLYGLYNNQKKAKKAQEDAQRAAELAQANAEKEAGTAAGMDVLERRRKQRQSSTVLADTATQTVGKTLLGE